MKEITKLTIAFSFKLLLILSVAFTLHETVYYFQKIAFNSFLILEAYLANFLMVVLSYWVLLFVKQKNNQAVGFTFLGGFFFKLIIFMILFNPIYREDNDVQTLEFLAFFVPYAICLAIETVSLVRLLNRS